MTFKYFNQLGQTCQGRTLRRGNDSYAFPRSAVVSEPDVWGIQNSLFGEGLVKAEEFRIPERLVTFDTV